MVRSAGQIPIKFGSDIYGQSMGNGQVSESMDSQFTGTL